MSKKMTIGQMLRNKATLKKTPSSEKPMQKLMRRGDKLRKAYEEKAFIGPPKKELRLRLISAVATKRVYKESYKRVRRNNSDILVSLKKAKKGWVKADRRLRRIDKFVDDGRTTKELQGFIVSDSGDEASRKGMRRATSSLLRSRKFSIRRSDEFLGPGPRVARDEKTTNNTILGDASHNIGRMNGRSGGPAESKRILGRPSKVSGTKLGVSLPRTQKSNLNAVEPKKHNKTSSCSHSDDNSASYDGDVISAMRIMRRSGNLGLVARFEVAALAETKLNARAKPT